MDLPTSTLAGTDQQLIFVIAAGTCRLLGHFPDDHFVIFTLVISTNPDHWLALWHCKMSGSSRDHCRHRQAVLWIHSGHLRLPLVSPFPPTLPLTFTVVYCAVVTGFLPGHPPALGCDVGHHCWVWIWTWVMVERIHLTLFDSFSLNQTISTPFLFVFGQIEVYFLSSILI